MTGNPFFGVAFITFILSAPKVLRPNFRAKCALLVLAAARDILVNFEISRAGIYPKYPEETVLFPVYTTRQRKFALYVTGVISTCKYFKFGLNTTGLSQSHFRNLSACSSALTRVLPPTYFAVTSFGAKGRV